MARGDSLDNIAPSTYEKAKDRVTTADELNDEIEDEIDSREIFDILSQDLYAFLEVDLHKCAVDVAFRPTIPHCSMATLIGLAIRVKLLRSLPPGFKLDVRILPGTHVSESAINKQLDDKERVAAALENSHLLQVVNRCLLLR
ncbi:cytosolic iron-sulfur assembly component 2B-like isoform X2 [Dermacentor silvarum]|uniref:cytosolic iron-sulfur assembly component 2B-like n=1 Tax=Dermacentor silvarum TaxID=543639 RepID=UPI001896D78A|nr:cytosolic iron-sulfur assembly component 2B-like [Dermacentor silvarum]XP_049511720.1 cytosolic iron-sulfur assembly component 2B-like isoform X2 [Dermacentor silvarum]